MAWTLNSIRIYAQEYGDEAKQVLARLQPLNAGTIIQTFGYEDNILTIGAIVVGDTDHDALMALRTTGSTYALVSPEGSKGNFYVAKVSSKRVPNICQTIRTDLAKDAPIYNMTLELYPA